MEKPTLIEVFCDNGEHSHWTLVKSENGEKIWSENPKECKAMGYPVITENDWKSVDDEKPPINIPIKCFQNNGFIQFRQLILGYDGDHFREFDTNEGEELFLDGEYSKITHWKYLSDEPSLNK